MDHVVRVRQSSEKKKKPSNPNELGKPEGWEELRLSALQTYVLNSSMGRRSLVGMYMYGSGAAQGGRV